MNPRDCAIIVRRILINTASSLSISLFCSDNENQITHKRTCEIYDVHYSPGQMEERHVCGYMTQPPDFTHTGTTKCHLVIFNYYRVNVTVQVVISCYWRQGRCEESRNCDKERATESRILLSGLEKLNVFVPQKMENKSCNFIVIVNVYCFKLDSDNGMTKTIFITQFDIGRGKQKLNN